MCSRIFAYTLKGVNLFTHSIWRDFETEFQDILNTLSIHIEALRDQATLAYRQKLYQSLDSQTRLTSEFMRHFHAISEQDKVSYLSIGTL